MSYRDNYPVGEILVKTADSAGAGGTEVATLQPPIGEEWIPIAMWGWHDDTVAARDCYWNWLDVKSGTSLQGTTMLALVNFIRVPLFPQLAASVAVAAGANILFTPKITRNSYPRFYGLLLGAGKKTHIAGLFIVRSGLA